ncbi:MAG: hypothetical protein HY721_31400, partial [Planctomycetes bacterium]|nr:hypothetical protein [Planctomycetota bacterium]
MLLEGHQGGSTFLSAAGDDLLSIGVSIGLSFPCVQALADCEQRLRRGDANSDGKLDL